MSHNMSDINDAASAESTTGDAFVGALAECENTATGGLIIAVDGPSGTGKSTTCRALATAANARYLDTGAMYRVATLHVLRAGIDPAATAAGGTSAEETIGAIIDATQDLPLEVNEDPTSHDVILAGENVAEVIRSAEVTAHVSAVAAIPEVRENLVELQRRLAAKAERCVVEGRDIGTVVLPDAPIKVFLTASAEVRARRRYDQDLAAGREADFDQVLADVQRRDEADSSRSVSPLRPAEDAFIVDTSGMTLDEVLNRLAELTLASAIDAEFSEDELDPLVFRTGDGNVIDDAVFADSTGRAGGVALSGGVIEDRYAYPVRESDNGGDEFDEEDFSAWVRESGAGDDDELLASDPDSPANRDRNAAYEEEEGFSELEALDDLDEDFEDFDPDVEGETQFFVADPDSFDLISADENATDWNALEEAFGLDRTNDIEEESLCTVAIVGRPNVGKSTLVNRFIGRREAVVEDFPGVTRDRISYLGEWTGRRFWVQDTGGWDPDAKGIHAAIARQAETAMETADAIVFVVDTKVGITSTDEVIARKLQRSEVPVILVANKFDSDSQYGDVAEFWGLGLGEPMPVSAQHGRGGADVLDLVLSSFPDVPRNKSIVSGPRRVALVGRPNVGKSSLLNKITGEERSVVDNVAGTTVDPVDSIVELEQQTWRFVDTAGIRKKTKTARGHEFYASLRTRSAIDSAEVAVFLVDASEPIAEQDQRVLRLILDSGRALVVAYNKWDLVDEDRRDLLEREIEQQLAHVPWARRVNISAKTGRALQKLEPAMIEALRSWDKRIPTGQLNTWLRAVIAETPPPMRGGRLPRVLFATQASTRPPVIVLFTTGFLEHGYRRFLERKLRESFGFEGSPVRIAVRVREKRKRS